MQRRYFTQVNRLQICFDSTVWKRILLKIQEAVLNDWPYTNPMMNRVLKDQHKTDTVDIRRPFLNVNYLSSLHKAVVICLIMMAPALFNESLVSRVLTQNCHKRCFHRTYLQRWRMQSRKKDSNQDGLLKFCSSSTKQVFSYFAQNIFVFSQQQI